MIEIYLWDQLSAAKKSQLLLRPDNQQKDLKNSVAAIIASVKQDKDAALKKFTAQFDNIQLQNFQVTAEEIASAFTQVEAKKLAAIKFAIERITHFHLAQVSENLIVDDSQGIICERQIRPIDRVGLYVPGGSAPLVSTLMMLAIPAKIAACKLRIIATPPQRDGCVNPYLLVTAELCGITQIYKVGGTQAIAALAYGTETIPKVDKIFGPGNARVTLAKQLCSQDREGAAIDMPAGPSEVVVIADNQANPAAVALDLLAQAEHGADSQVILCCLSQNFAEAVIAEINAYLGILSRKNIIEKSLAHSRIFLVKDIYQGIEISNTYAPEHLILNVVNPENYSRHVTAAGTVFLGRYAAESLGDYTTGSNHVLPTYGYARSYSGLSLRDFYKQISFQRIDEQGLHTLGAATVELAILEGLDAHATAVKVRLEEINQYE